MGADGWDPHENGGISNPYFSRNLNDWELQREFLSRLEGKVVRRNEDDRLDWSDAEKSQFLVKSFYSFMRQERVVTFPSKAIWNS